MSAEPLGAAALAGVFLLIGSWPAYVFAGSQAAFVCAVFGACTAAATLAWERSWLLVVFLVGEMALLGTEANGAIAPGDPPLGTFRLIDASVGVGLLTLALRSIAAMRTQTWSTFRPHLLARRIALPVISLFALALWAVVLWLVNGAKIDAITRTDVRVTGLAVGTWIIASYCARSSSGRLGLALALLAVPLTVKAFAIYLADFWVIGVYDRLQAALTEELGHTRVVLVGGDTLLIVVPAIAVASLAAAGRVGRWLLISAAACAAAAILISGSRTGIIVMVLGVAVALFATRKSLPGRLRVRHVALLLAATIALVAASIPTGVAKRFTTPDLPHVGLNFREEEAESVARLPTIDLALGQGIGGRFYGKDVNGRPVVTGWAHSFPLWLVLKVGVFGFALAMTLGVLMLWRAVSRLRTSGASDQEALLALVLMVGVLAMSLTLGRAALPEGAMLLALAAALLRPIGAARN